MKKSKYLKPITISIVALGLVIGFFMHIAKDPQPVAKAHMAKKSQKSNKG